VPLSNDRFPIRRCDACSERRFRQRRQALLECSLHIRSGAGMANIASILREEIGRLSRREIRKATESTKKGTNQHRHAIATLKNQVTQLERQVSTLTRTMARLQQGSAAASDSDSSSTKIRFVAKGLRSHRSRLGLSAGDFGKLVGVTANSVYGWESGKTTPRKEQLAKIAALRTVGKREAEKRLDTVRTTKTPARTPKTRARTTKRTPARTTKTGARRKR